MDRSQKREGKLELRKSWQYLLYIDLVLPGLLFLAAFVTRGSSFGISLGRVFHTYGLYVSSPVPNLDPFNGTGVLGLLITLGLLLWAARRRDWKDLALTLALGGANALYFALGGNYALLPYLTLTASPF